MERSFWGEEISSCILFGDDVDGWFNCKGFCEDVEFSAQL